MKNSSFYFLLLFLFSCNGKDVNENNSTVLSNDSTIDKISIFINYNTGIWVNPKFDSIYIAQRIQNDTAQNPVYRSDWKILKRIKSKSFSDSIYAISYDLILHPVFSDGNFVTDYAGNYLKITIGNKSSEISFSYSSIGDWKTENQKTSTLWKFLKRNNLLEGTDESK